jgi:acetolactate decarboxylase
MLRLIQSIGAVLNEDELFLESSIAALLEGRYRGRLSFAEVAAHGDFGLGTFDSLDGEMVALGGEFFQCRSDGSVRLVDPGQSTPFAAVKFFRADFHHWWAEGGDYPRLTRWLDERLPDPMLAYAIHAQGHFECIAVRVVERQSPPFRPLDQITQVEFEGREVPGSLVGFRFPPEAEHLGGPGYHFHFLSADRTFGGHLLWFQARQLQIEMDQVRQLHLALPPPQPLSPEQTLAMRRVELPGA